MYIKFSCISEQNAFKFFFKDILRILKWKTHPILNSPFQGMSLRPKKRNFVSRFSARHFLAAHGFFFYFKKKKSFFFLLQKKKNQVVYKRAVFFFFFFN